MNPSLQSQIILGFAAVALALIIVDKVMSFLKGSDGKDSSGAQTVEFWRKQNKEGFSEVLKESAIPILQKQVEILDELKVNASRLVEMQIKIQLSLDSLIGRQEAVNQNVHQLRTDVQNLGNALRAEIANLGVERRKGRG